MVRLQGTLPEDLQIDGIDIYESIFYNQSVRENFVYYGYNIAGDDTGYLAAIRIGKWKMHFRMINTSNYMDT